MERLKYDCIVLGGGPAGISAAIYCHRSNLSCAIIDKGLLGGRPLGYLEIENYVGLGRLETFDMVEKFKEHLALFNIPTYEFENIVSVDLENKVIITDKKEFECKSIIIATGSRPKLLGVKGEEEYTGRGVHYCAICDGPFYKGKHVAVIGGGNSACEEALGLSKICDRVIILEFMDKLNADQITINQIEKTDNIEVYTGYAVTEIEKVTQEQADKFGISAEELKPHMFILHASPRENFETKEGVVTYEAGKPRLKLWVNGIFPYIGMTANSELFDVEKDRGFIVTTENMETSVKGVYAVGDVRVTPLRQVITSVSDGAIAGVMASRYINSLSYSVV